MLIDGSFSAPDAWEIIRNLYTSKIRFHEMRNFSLSERFGKEDPITVKKIRELKESMKEVSEILHSDSGGRKFEIKSIVSIKFSDDENQNVQ